MANVIEYCNTVRYKLTRFAFLGGPTKFNQIFKSIIGKAKAFDFIYEMKKRVLCRTKTNIKTCTLREFIVIID